MPSRAIINYHSTGMRTDRSTVEPNQNQRKRSSSRPRSYNNDRSDDERMDRDYPTDRRNSRPRGRGNRARRGFIHGYNNFAPRGGANVATERNRTTTTVAPSRPTRAGMINNMSLSTWSRFFWTPANKTSRND